MKPTQLPVWGNDLSNVTEPSGGQKSTGWTPNSTGVSSWFNWLANLQNEWISYLDVGRIAHGERTRVLHPSVFVGSGGLGEMASSGYYQTVGGAHTAFAPLTLANGSRVKQVVIYYDRNGSAGVTCYYKRRAVSTGTLTTISTGATDSSSVGIQTLTFAGLTESVSASDAHFIEVSFGAGTSARIHGARFTWDFPDA